MKMHQFERTQSFPISIEECWNYFSNPLNLKDITPPSLNFTMISLPSEEMYEGMIIEYTVTPIVNIKIRWVAEIKHVNKPNYFIDEQRFGPFKFWQHQHMFKEIEDGVEMKDLIYYGLFFDHLSRPVQKLLVKKEIQQIFDYRQDVLLQKFGEL